MRNLFLLILVLLLGFSQFMTWRISTKGAGGELVYWVTDPNPARPAQVAAFRAFLKRVGMPAVDLRVDYQNTGLQKLIVQGVSGVASDLIDVAPGAVPYLAEMGLLEPLDEPWAQLGLDPKELWPSVSNDYYYKGRPYGHPMSTSLDAPLVNLDSFKSLGLPPPPMRWNFDTFEAAGKLFVAKANAGKSRREYFFISALKPDVLRRTAGVSYYNETLTGPGLDVKNYVDVLTRVGKWVNEDHLAPTDAENQSFSSEQGYGGAQFQMFQKGYFGMLVSGRHALIQLRQMKGAVHYAAVEFPHHHYPTAQVATRSSVIYKGSPQKVSAARFHAFLRSPEYGDAMISGGDAIPPTRSFVDEKEFMTPAATPNEWALHQGLKTILTTIAEGREYTPFALQPEVIKAEVQGMQSFWSGITTPSETTKLMAEKIQGCFDSYMKRHPELRAEYDRQLAVQKKIDAIKAAGGTIPLDLVPNSFLKRYLKDTGKGK